MRLQQITATPHPTGNQISLYWKNPVSDQYPGVRVVRREDTYPTTINDGTVVAEEEGLETAEDQSLKDETVYYYTLFLYRLSPLQYHFDPHNRTAAMVTSPYNKAGQMYDLLPSIYHRYDTESEQLRRFLDLPGEQFDQFYSFASALLNAYNLDRVDGRLLPLLAEWIGWQTNYRLEIAKQRNEIRYAPYLYQTMGLIPTLEATVKRIIGWESRTKEFVHNVFRSNCPERLNIWLRQRNSSGEWSQATKPLSLNFAYEGRPSAVRDGNGQLWLFFHTLKQNSWEIWDKTYNSDEKTWTPSQPLNLDKNSQSIEKEPTAVLQGERLWVFWSTYVKEQKRWQINYRTRTDVDWSKIQPSDDEPDRPQPWSVTDAHNRRQPWAVTDTSNGLWLFWIESIDGQQQLKYNRHDGTNWQLADAATFPLVSGQNPRVVNDVFVFVHPTEVTQPLWVFWTRQEPAGTISQTRWQIAYRVKEGLDPTETSDWSEVRILPWAEEGNDDREPSALVREDGNIELFWSSTRSGSWSIWHTLLEPTTHTWGTAEPITNGQYSQRAPLCLPDSEETILIYRSNQSLTYTGEIYGATETTDFRYVGCITVDTRNLSKLNLRGEFDDSQTYTSVVMTKDRPTSSDEWYAWYANRNTVGLYLTPTTEDPALLERDQELLKNVLPQFLPIQTQVEIWLQPIEVEENYDTIQEITESALQEEVGFLNESEIYSDGVEAASDHIPEWQLFMTNSLSHLTVNLATSPIEVGSRSWHSALTYE
jgi:phage tail-like protein